MLQSFFIKVIRLGLEPKTYCLEGSCSIQLSYRTSLILISLCGKSAAKVVIFFEPTKFFIENMILRDHSVAFGVSVCELQPEP